MTRRDLLWAAVAPAAAPRPNVVIILADDQGHGDLSAHGNPRLKTPNLDKLHRDSVRLTNFHVAPMCTPTRAQLMTGRDALNTSATNVSSGRTLLRRDLPTLADMFAAQGYRTGLFGKWHLGDNYPYRPQDRGFQESIWFPWLRFTASLACVLAVLFAPPWSLLLPWPMPRMACGAAAAVCAYLAVMGPAIRRMQAYESTATGPPPAVLD